MGLNGNAGGGSGPTNGTSVYQSGGNGFFGIGGQANAYARHMPTSGFESGFGLDAIGCGGGGATYQGGSNGGGGGDYGSGGWPGGGGGRGSNAWGGNGLVIVEF